MTGAKMKLKVFALTVGLTQLAVPANALQKPMSSPPVAEYWMSVSTTTGISSILGGGRPTLGGMAGMLLHGGPDFNAVSHRMMLQLGSRQTTAAPQAEHLPPPGLNVGPSLPLLTPQVQAPARVSEDTSPQVEKYRQEKPRGRILIFWGCGEHVGPGQPYVIDLAQMTGDPQSMMKMAAAFKSVATSPERPPSPATAATYGDWPNAKSTIPIPATGSLVGDHLVRGDYAPEIHFSLGPQNDFMGPITLTGNARTPSGSVNLSWQPVAGAYGYLASVIGAGGGGPGGGDGAMVIWTSSQGQMAGFALPQYLSTGDIHRLVDERRLMDSTAVACTVPQEVAAVAQSGLLSMTAYGGEVNISDPPRPLNPRAPWNPIWTVKVRYRSATSALLGQPMPGGGAPAAPPSNQDRVNSVLRGLGGLMPH